MLIYNYHPITKEYLGSSKANSDPLETAKQKKEIFLLPANATFEPSLETGKNEKTIFDNGWKVVSDFRGKKYYLETGEEITITELGVTVPEGALLEAPAPPEPTEEELYEAAIKAKEAEILRRQAIVEIEAEKVILTK